MKSLCFSTYPTPNPIVWKPLYIQTNQEPLSEIDGEAEHSRRDWLIYNTSFPSRHGKGHKGLPPGEHLGQLLSQTCISSPQWCQIPNGHSKMLVICHLAAGGSVLKCENTECTNNGTWPLTHFLKQTLISIAHIKWNTTTVANLGLMHGLYLKIDGASGLKKKRRPTRQLQKPAFYYLASKDRQKWLQKDCVSIQKGTEISYFCKLVKDVWVV